MRLKIKQLATVQMGYSFRSRLETSQYGKISVIQMKDLLQNNTVDCSKLVNIDIKGIKEHHVAKKGDLVFRSRGQIRTASILLENPGKAVVAAPLLRIRIRKPDKILPEYLNWYISQRESQIFLTSRNTQKMISKQSIENLEVYLPNLKQQEKIVELANLSAMEQTILDALAEKRKQYISTVLMQIIKEEKKYEQ